MWSAMAFVKQPKLPLSLQTALLVFNKNENEKELTCVAFAFFTSLYGMKNWYLTLAGMCHAVVTLLFLIEWFRNCMRDSLSVAELDMQ